MDNLINLKDLLTHEILDLYSAEKQIIDALPGMIEKAYDIELKNALQDHFEVTKTHKLRLEKIYSMLAGNTDVGEALTEDTGFFSRLFGGVSQPKCKGTEGLLAEGKKMMNENMTTEVKDAALIASVQKIEHYEIAGYGTALAYARQLNMEFVATLLEETLNEEYEADDLLTELAIGKINIDAENAVDNYNTDEIDSNRLRNFDSPTEKSLFADFAHETNLPVTSEDKFADNPQSNNSNKNVF